MSHRSLAALAAMLALAAPRPASAGDGWSVTVGVWGGVSRYDVLGLKHGIGTVGSADGQDLIDGNFNAVGGSAVLRIRWLELGALYEGTLLDRDAKSDVLTPLVGVAWDLSPRVRVDVLAELGGHRITDIGSGNPFAAEPPKTVWLPSLGVRPSVAVRLPAGPASLVLSATPFARWDLVKKDVSVRTSALDPTVYEAGGTTFGVVAGVGIEL
jgi:hypothetical protein